MLARVRSKVRIAMIIAIFIIAVALIIRAFLDTGEIDTSGGFFEAFRNVTDVFINPFVNISNLDRSKISNINTDALVAAILLTIIGLIFTQFATGLLYRSRFKFLESIADTIFKTVELFLSLRIIFDYFEIKNGSQFIDLTNDLTLWLNDIWDFRIAQEKINIVPVILLVIIFLFDIFVFDFILHSGNSRIIQIKRKLVRPMQKPPQQPVPTFQNTIDWRDPNTQYIRR